MLLYKRSDVQQTTVDGGQTTYRLRIHVDCKNFCSDLQYMAICINFLNFSGRPADWNLFIYRIAHRGPLRPNPALQTNQSFPHSRNLDRPLLYGHQWLHSLENLKIIARRKLKSGSRHFLFYIAAINTSQKSPGLVKSAICWSELRRRHVSGILLTCRFPNRKIGIFLARFLCFLARILANIFHTSNMACLCH